MRIIKLIFIIVGLTIKYICQSIRDWWFSETWLEKWARYSKKLGE